MIPIWLILSEARNAPLYTGRARGSTVVRVQCKKCGSSYRYRMRRVSSESVYRVQRLTAQMMDDADAAAAADLDRMLATDFDYVPCQHCGDYQPEMVERMRDESVMWTKSYIAPGFIIGAAILICAAFVFGLLLLPMPQLHTDNAVEALTSVGLLAGMAGGIVIGFAIGLRTCRGWFRTILNPNRPKGVADRMAYGRDRERDATG